MDPDLALSIAEVCKALSDTTRMKILEVLAIKSFIVRELAHAVGTKPVNITHHMNVLREAKLILTTKQGRNVHCALNPSLVMAPQQHHCFATIHVSGVIFHLRGMVES